MLHDGHTFKTIDKEASSLFTEKNSKFYSDIFPVTNQEEIKSLLDKIRKKYPKASHYCYGFRLGIGEVTEKAHDAGEPSGSAGMPILNTLKSHELTNIILIVTRYFGGTQLGIPGLIKAYKSAAQLVTEQSQIIEKPVKMRFRLASEANQAGVLYKISHLLQADIRSSESNPPQEILHIELEKEKASQLEKLLGEYYYIQCAEEK